MASELPEGALRKIADSLKPLITPADGAHTSTAKQAALDTPPTGAGTASAATQSCSMEQTLHMEQAAPVEHETVKSLEHEIVETVIHREIHQDHYHRTIQPIRERVVLPAKHIYIDTNDERGFDHRIDTAAEGASRDAHLYPDEGGGHNLRSTKKNLPTLQDNEHANCYVEETVRNVVTKETIILPPIETTRHIHKSRRLTLEQESATAAPKAIAGEPRKRDEPSKKAGQGTEHKKQPQS